MKKWLPIFLICLISFISLTPKVGIFAYTQDDYYEAIASYFLADMLVSGDANEISFDIGNDNTQFLIDFGEALVTGDYTGLAEYGLERAQDFISDVRSSIYDAIYVINPSIYDFLISDDYVQVKPSYGTITRHLLTELSDDAPSPSPPIDYATYIELANGEASGNGFWWYYLSSPFNQENSTRYWTFNNNISNYSFYSYSNQFDVINSEPYITNNHCYVADSILTLVIVSNNDDTYTGSISGISPYYQFFTQYDSSNNVWDRVSRFGFIKSNSDILMRSTLARVTTSPTTFTYTGSLVNVLSTFVYRFKNINIIVDGIPWATVGNNNTKPIILGDSLTIINDYPAKYYYNQPVYFDMNGLLTIIKNAINDSDVLTYSDIEDLIVDVNGQPAVAVVNFARTDYDILASEQIPYYPKFYYDVNLNQYAQAGAQIVNISTEVLPRDVLNIIITCGVILIFGYVVRRLLE